MPVMSCGVGNTRTRGDHDARVPYYSVEIRPGADVQWNDVPNAEERNLILYLGAANGLADTVARESFDTHRPA
jgi:hypothetical protein